MTKCFDGVRCPDRESCLRFTAPKSDAQTWDNYYRQRGTWRAPCKFYIPLIEHGQGQRRAAVAA